MNKTELVAKVAALSGQTKVDTIAVIDAVADVIKNQIKAGGELKLVGLFTISVVDKPARKARNPSTGEVVEIPARKATKIKLAKELR